MRTLEVVASFMADCKLRGLSPKTVETYSLHTTRLARLSPKYPPKPAVIQQFLATVRGPHNADSHYRTFRALDNYARRRFRTKNFMNSVTRPRVQRQIMPTITGTELDLLATFLETAPERDRAIVALFIDTAIRKGEAANLKRDDIQEDRIIVHGKTGYRVAPISEDTRDMLLSLPAQADGFVFHGVGPHRDKPLGATGLYKIVRKYLRLAGRQGRQRGPQILRRSFGKFWLMDGGDLKSLSLIMGHQSVKTTDEYYTPLLAEDIVRLHKRHTPGKIFQRCSNSEIYD